MTIVQPIRDTNFICAQERRRWRMCIDYRGLNKQPIKDRYLLQRIDLFLDRLGKARIFSKLALTQGYHQIAMAEDLISKTAFCTHLGQCEYVVIPFGLSNAPSAVQRLMSQGFCKGDKFSYFRLFWTTF